DLHFRVTRVARVLNRGAIGKDCKRLDTQVNADGFERGMKDTGGIELIFTGKDGKPLVAFPFDGAGLDLALDLAVQLDLEVTNLGEVQAIPDEFIAPLWVGEAIIAVATFEPGVACLLAILDATEEGVKGFLQPPK